MKKQNAGYAKLVSFLYQNRHDTDFLASSLECSQETATKLIKTAVRIHLNNTRKRKTSYEDIYYVSCDTDGDFVRYFDEDVETIGLNAHEENQIKRLVGASNFTILELSFKYEYSQEEIAKMY